MELIDKGNDSAKRQNRCNKSRVGSSETQSMIKSRVMAEYEKAVIPITNMHYRKYYKNDLENVKSIFDPKKPIFDKYEVKRGASRGVSGGLFGRKKQDAVGENTDEKVVGRFKGMVEVYNQDTRAQEKKDAKQLSMQIFDKIKQIWIKKNDGKPFDFKLNDLADPKKAEELWKDLKKAHINVEPIKQLIKRI